MSLAVLARGAPPPHALWPLLLPQVPLVDGYSDTLPNLQLRSAMDTGVPKRRMRSTAGVGPQTRKFKLTREQTRVLEDFHNYTCLGGTLTFIFINPRTRKLETVAWVGPPVFTRAQGQILWLADCEWETMP